MNRLSDSWPRPHARRGAAAAAATLLVLASGALVAPLAGAATPAPSTSTPGPSALTPASSTTTPATPVIGKAPIGPGAAAIGTGAAPIGTGAAPIGTAAGTYVPPSVTIIAAAKNKLTPVYDRLGATKPFTTLNNRTNFSGRHVFLVLAREGDWYRVELPMRPNGRIGYVRAADVALYQHDYAIHVSLSAHTMVVYKAGKEIMRETVAVGSAKYPTPVGSYYLRELARPSNPKGAYGPFAFGVSAYSNVLQSFGRGDGQIGVHGTNAPGQLGQNVSHGCIRVRNAAITQLAKTLPQGVPIDIVA
jgi:hypothetical protein